MTGAADDPAAGVDARITRLAPGVTPPAGHRRDVVLVTGPWLAGTSAVAAALRDRLPDREFAEPADLAAGEAPAAVVFVVSAAAALTESDCALLDAAAADTDVVVGAVSKIDAHRQWPQMLDAARDGLTGHAPRYRNVPWVGVAAAPELGEPRVHELAAEVCRQLDGPAVRLDAARRNRLRAWESQLARIAGRYQRDVEAAGGRTLVASVRGQREDVLRQCRLAKSERAAALRSRIAQARVQLSYFARNRCNSVRAELADDAAATTRRGLPGFEGYVRRRVGEVVVEVDGSALAHLDDAAHTLGLAGCARTAAPPEVLGKVEVTGPALKAHRLETQLMMLLGAGFGLGVALTLSRLFAGLARGPAAGGAAACVVVGLAVTVWVVGTRSLLRDRAALDRWVSEVVAVLRSAVEELVALRVLSAESALSAALAERNEAEGTRAAGRVAALDAELREHATAAARAATVRDSVMPSLLRALHAVRGELGDRVPDGRTGDGDGPAGTHPPYREPEIRDSLWSTDEHVGGGAAPP